jgi:hypothetical protein
VSFGAAFGTGNPIGAAFEIFQQLIGLFRSASSVDELIRRYRKLQNQFQVMSGNGLFGTQVQLRKVQDRSIWEEIGYAEPADVPHIFANAPAGTTFTVKDFEFPRNDFTSLWVSRRVSDFAHELRFPEGTWWGSVFRIDLGDPSDTIPGIGREGVVRHDFAASALAAGLARQPKQFLGPRALAGEDAAIRRAAFRAGGGSPLHLWFTALDEQARREGRRVRTWGGRGFIDINPNTPALDERTATAFRSSGFRTFSIGSGVRDPQVRLIFDLLNVPGNNRGGFVTPTVSPFVRGKLNLLTESAATQLFNLGIRSPSDFRKLPALLGAT